MTDKAAITGDFATYRHVQGRKVVQLVIEVPAELAASVFATLGHPGSGEAIPVAIARLVEGVKAEPAVDRPATPEAPPDKQRRAFSDMPLSQQAALRCAQADFQRYICVPDEKTAARLVRQTCRVTSRSMLDTDCAAAERWRRLDDAFFMWQRGMTDDGGRA
jgi:hypothetical protein